MANDIDGDSLIFAIISEPKNGGVSGTGANLTYTPNANYSGSDSFTFKANDGSTDSNTATVSISVIENVVVELTPSEATYEGGEEIEVTFVS